MCPCEEESLAQCMNCRSLLYDKKTGEEHYNIISALHKSMRNSDLTRQSIGCIACWTAGGSPISQEGLSVLPAKMWEWRIPRIAGGSGSHQACHFIGMPECDVHLTHAVVYLSMAPKSNALYMACEAVQKGRPRSAGGTGASSDSQCADKINERSGVRQRLHLRPRH